MAIEESCIYTLTPDQNPIIDSLPDRQNVVFGVGFSGMGFKLGPVTGRMLADLAQVQMMLSSLVIRSLITSVHSGEGEETGLGVPLTPQVPNFNGLTKLD